jgi:hypothetical protein
MPAPRRITVQRCLLPCTIKSALHLWRIFIFQELIFDANVGFYLRRPGDRSGTLLRLNAVVKLALHKINHWRIWLPKN